MIKTVGDIKKYLSSQNISPEELATRVGISNMTIRRLIKRDPAGLVPTKYALQFESLSAASGQVNIDGLMSAIDLSGKRVPDLKQLQVDLDVKLKDVKITDELKSRLQIVFKGAMGKGNKKYAALCIGALLYFINPADLIPDALGPFGYLDDLAVLSLVAAQAPMALRKFKGARAKT